MIETALLCAIITIPLLVGTGEMGVLAYDSIEVTNAANAGATYGMQSVTNASNTSSITTAAQMEAADFGSALNVNSSTYYACATAVTGTQYTGANAQANAQAGCTGTNNHALLFIKVTTNTSITPNLRFPGSPSSFNVTGSSVMEVEQ